MISATGQADRPVASARRAFTLVEVILAMALIGLLGSLAVISFPAMLRAVENPPLDDQLVSAVRQARLSAIRQGETTEMAFGEESGSLSFANAADGADLSFPGGGFRSVQFRATFGLGEPGPRGVIGPNGVLGFDRLTVELEDGTRVEIGFDPLTGREVTDEGE